MADAIARGVSLALSGDGSARVRAVGTEGAICLADLMHGEYRTVGSSGTDS